MNATSLERKTIRPGSLLGYSYYHSARRPVTTVRTTARTQQQSRSLRRWSTLLALVLVVLLAVTLLRNQASPVKQTSTLQASSTHSSTGSTPKSTPRTTTPAAAPAAAGPCSSNTLNQLVLISISQRHLWACQGNQSIYDSPVVTGMENLAADKTPTGTYHIYAKNTDISLKGQDTTGSWNDYVYYWMPFLHNQYGSYGFHDATWRSDSAFGNISPNSSDASHGCVELPLSTAKWLYDWAHVGTAVTIEG